MKQKNLKVITIFTTLENLLIPSHINSPDFILQLHLIVSDFIISSGSSKKDEILYISMRIFYILLRPGYDLITKSIVQSEKLR